MSSLFGTPKLEFGPTLSSGLAPWKHEVKPKSGDNYKFVPLHSLDESFSMMMMRKQVQYEGQGFKYVPSGKHLNPPVESPFNTDPRKEVNQVKPVYYMAVLVLSGNDDLKGHVGFVELRNNMKKRDGTYDRMAKYEDDSDSHSVKGIKCSLSRTGSGQTDTVYESSITDAYKISKAETEVIERELPEIVEYIKSLYLTGWDEERFKKVYNEGVVNGVVNKPTSTETVVGEPEFNTEIPF